MTRNSTMVKLGRSDIFPEKHLPDVQQLSQQGRGLASKVWVGDCPFLKEHKVASENEFKTINIAKGRVMTHAQIGYRSTEKSQRAYREIYEKLTDQGYSVDRYGICLDWSMGYPRDKRQGMPKGTGLILEDEQDYADLTACAPAAPHFGDFVLGMPAALENTIASLRAGSTSIGNIGQYFNFRLPHWDDDVFTTAETLKALYLCAAQPVPILIHSNLDDGFAALFRDLSCGIGAVLIEQYIIDELVGGKISHCYGHTFSDPMTRYAFQLALRKVSKSHGSMIYGNTTTYEMNEIANYANLGNYLLVDIVGQRRFPSGHAINPVPVTEAKRIPDINEIVDAHIFANAQIERSVVYDKMFDMAPIEKISEQLVAGGQQFKHNVLNGLSLAGVDTSNAFEMLLALKRLGAKKLEALFGPGQMTKHSKFRQPTIKATTIGELDKRSEEIIAKFTTDQLSKIQSTNHIACVCSTDVHEYGKILLENVFDRLNLTYFDAGVSADPDDVARFAKTNRVSFIAISTYNGVALSYIQHIQSELKQLNYRIPVFIGGQLNQIVNDNSSNLPVSVINELSQAGVTACLTIEDLLKSLLQLGALETTVNA